MKIKIGYSTLCFFILIQIGTYHAFAVSTLKYNVRTETQAPVTYISGHLDTGDLQDTMILEILKEFSSSANTFSVERSLVQVTKGGDFKFALPASDRPVYISLHTPYIPKVHYADWRHHLLDLYLLMPGDSIHINYLDNEKRIVFSGKSAAQFSWQYETRQQVKLKTASLPKAAIHSNPEQWLMNQDTIFNLVLKRLPAIKQKVKPDTYAIIQADAIGMYLGNTYMNLSILDLGAAFKDSLITNRTINAYYMKLYNQLTDTSSSKLLASSRFYATYLLNKARTEYKYKRLVDIPHPKDFFTDLKNTFPSEGPLKEKMIMAYLYQRIAGSAITDTMIHDALTIVNNPRYRKMLLGMQETFGKGELVVTNYEFKDKENRLVRLSDYKGKVIFIDMWFTGCAGCIQVAKGLPKVEEEFNSNSDVVFVSLSIDKDKAKWMRSVDGNNKVLNAVKTMAYTHFTTSDTKYIYTGGVGADHEFIKKYNPTGTYPHLLLINKVGQIFTSDVPLPVNKEGQDKLIRLINEALNEK